MAVISLELLAQPCYFGWLQAQAMFRAFSTGCHSHPQMTPILADVNVHPTKQEVRISKERELMCFTLLSEIFQICSRNKP